MTYQNTQSPTPEEKHSSSAPNVELPANTNKALQSIIGSMEELSSIYTEENKALSQTDSQAFLDMQESKYQAAIRYEALIRQMIDRKDEIAQADPDLKSKLQTMKNQFSLIKEENKAAIERMQNCTRRLGDTLRRAAIKATQRQQTNTYSHTGDMPNSSKGRLISTGINEKA